jgi:hypothetical protein
VGARPASPPEQLSRQLRSARNGDEATCVAALRAQRARNGRRARHVFRAPVPRALTPTHLFAGGRRRRACQERKTGDSGVCGGRRWRARAVDRGRVQVRVGGTSTNTLFPPHYPLPALHHDRPQLYCCSLNYDRDSSACVSAAAWSPGTEEQLAATTSRRRGVDGERRWSGPSQAWWTPVLRRGSHPFMSAPRPRRWASRGVAAARASASRRVSSRIAPLTRRAQSPPSGTAPPSPRTRTARSTPSGCAGTRAAPRRRASRPPAGS